MTQDDLFPILMAEDNADDILATQRAWKKGGLANQLLIVRDGAECLDYLHMRGNYSDPASAPRPGLLLLDLNMPKLGGLDVLRDIREVEHLRGLPVIVLTTSKADEDRVESYKLRSNAYIQKPVSFDGLVEAIKRIHRFWAIVELPDRNNGYK